jgi:hypothetical protein
MEKRTILAAFVVFITLTVHSQSADLYQKGLTADQNLKAIGELAPYSTGGVGFDTRYQGVKGTTRLIDTLCPSFLRIKGQDYYLQLKTDIDLVRNTLLFIHPKTGKLLALPSSMVSEVVITNHGREMVFRTTSDLKFDKDFKDPKFFQVLKDSTVAFIKMPVKIFTEADFKGAYSPDRRYDEYETKYRYYIRASDDVFRQVQLNRKSISKLFPAQKELISSAFESAGEASDEAIVLSILAKIR